MSIGAGLGVLFDVIFDTNGLWLGICFGVALLVGFIIEMIEKKRGKIRSLTLEEREEQHQKAKKVLVSAFIAVVLELIFVWFLER
ncbi:MAG: hypothetical protein Q8P93_02715 [bacterium]|nr:hypothetical protein [bacterium]